MIDRTPTGVPNERPTRIAPARSDSALLPLAERLRDLYHRHYYFWLLLLLFVAFWLLAFIVLLMPNMYGAVVAILLTVVSYVESHLYRTFLPSQTWILFASSNPSDVAIHYLTRPDVQVTIPIQFGACGVSLVTRR
jgi:uncharacterized membrane protein